MTLEKANKICNIVQDIEDTDEMVDCLENILCHHSEVDELILKIVQDAIYELKDHRTSLLITLDEM